MAQVSRIVFNKYDVEKTGHITDADFKHLCYDMGHFLTEQEAALAVKMIDKDGGGKIEYDEFMKWWRSEDKWGKLKLSEDQLQKLQTASNYFQYFDKDKSGSIDRKEFTALHADLVKNKFTSKSLDNCLADLDENNDGKVEFNEYIDWLVRLGSIPVKVL